MNHLIRLTPIPDYGDLMTIEEFKKANKTGYLLQGEDGSGYWAFEDLVSDLYVDIHALKPYKSFTHVMWYNK